jgi:glutamate/tyrosine decarboxylase-like PLP-dependent enzyme
VTKDVDRDRLNLSTEAMRRLGYRVVDHLVDRWATLADLRIPTAPDRDALREALSGPPPREGRDPAAVIDRAVREVLAEAAPTGHPRFFGFIPSPSNFVAVLADALVAGFNPFGGNWMEAPGPHELERVTIGWVRDACGLPEPTSGLFVSGGSMANLTALAAARTARLGDDTRGARVYVSDQTHGSVAKGLRVLGFPRDAVVCVPTDARFSMRPDALAEAIAADRAAGLRPFCVVATAGTTNTGAVDPLDAIADRCAREDLWMHVDGAYGAAAAFSERARAALAGLERADSVSLDPHKWLFTPYECACVLVREGGALTDAFAIRADYLADTVTDEPDLQDQGVQLTRSFRALKVWMTFQVFGADALARAIDAGVARAESVQRRVEAMPGWELAAPASMGICAFRYAPEGLEDADALNFGLVPRLVETGEAMVTSTVLNGRRYLRMCAINPRTTDDDVARTLARLDALARAPR